MFLAKRAPVPGFLSPKGYIGQRGARGASQGSQEGPWRAPPRAAPGTLLVAWWWPSASLLVIPEGSVWEIFNLIFLEFFGQFNPSENLKYKNSRKQELATGCTESVG